LLPGLSNKRKKTGSQFNPHRHSRSSLSLQSHASYGLDPGRNYPGAQEASAAAYCIESRRGLAVLKLRTALQASHHPGDVLPCRVAHLRGCPPESRRYRQPANGHSSRTRERAERSRCHAFAKVAANPASLVASEQAQAVALPRRSSRRPHYQGGGGGRVPEGASNLPDFQTDHTSFASARIRSSSAGIRHRRAHHSTATWSSQPGYHGPLSAYRHYQGVLHHQPTRSAPAADYR